MRIALPLIGSFLFALGAFVVLAMRVLHPHHRIAAFVLFVAAWCSLFVAAWRHRAALQRGGEVVHRALAGWWPHVVLAVVLIVIGWAAFVIYPPEWSPLRGLDDAAIRAECERDLQLACYLDERLRADLVTMCRLAEITGEPDAAQREELRRTWGDFSEACFELDALKRRYRTFAQVNGFTRPLPHGQAFVAGYTAFVSQYRAAVELTRVLGEHDALRTVLDEGAANGMGPAPGAFSRMQGLTVHPEIVLQLNAGRAYLALVRRRSPELEPAAQRIDAWMADIDAAVGRTPEVFVENPLAALERKSFRAWFPVQKRVAILMSRVRTTDRDYFIRPEDVAAHAGDLAPGDILLQRREWHLTNLGIPGWWTHAALHVGTLAELDAYFADLPELDGRRPTDVIRERFPTVFEEMSRPDESGWSPAVIEALRPGVILQSLEESGRCDALAALRPRLTRAERWRVVTSAFAHHGKPYDYNFDFTTDGTLVCSELVSKAHAGLAGIDFDPIRLNGRLVLPPNALAEKFDRELGTDRQQLDLALFLDGSGKQQRAGPGDAEAFRQSWRRAKWHVVFN